MNLKLFHQNKKKNTPRTNSWSVPTGPGRLLHLKDIRRILPRGWRSGTTPRRGVEGEPDRTGLALELGLSPGGHPTVDSDLRGVGRSRSRVEGLDRGSAELAPEERVEVLIDLGNFVAARDALGAVRTPSVGALLDERIHLYTADLDDFDRDGMVRFLKSTRSGPLRHRGIEAWVHRALRSGRGRELGPLLRRELRVGARGGIGPRIEVVQARLALAGSDRRRGLKAVEALLRTPPNRPRIAVRGLLVDLAEQGERELALDALDHFARLLEDPWGRAVRRGVLRAFDLHDPGEGPGIDSAKEALDDPIRTLLLGRVSPENRGRDRSGSPAEAPRGRRDGLSGIDPGMLLTLLREVEPGARGTTRIREDRGTRIVGDVERDLRTDLAGLRGALVYHGATGRLVRGDAVLELGAHPTLRRLFEELWRGRGTWMVKERLYPRVWEARFDPEIHDRNVYTGIARLRRQLERVFDDSSCIQSRTRGGFRFVPPTGSLWIEGLSPAHRRGLDGPRARVFDQLVGVPGSSRDLALRTDLPVKVVRSALAVLVRRGYVERFGRGNAVTYQVMRDAPGPVSVRALVS